MHALECLSQSETTAAIAGFNYFGLAAASSVFQQVPDGSEEMEERLNQVYSAIVPSDETLVLAFRVKLLASPEAFAPTESGAHV